MKKLIALLTVYGLILTPLYANAAAVRPASTPANGGSSPAGTVSLLEAAEIAAASGAYRVQNTADITTGRIREDDKKRSAIAFALSGALAFVGAGLWRWLPCRNQEQANNIAGLEIEGYNKCYDADGQRLGLDTPTKLLIGAGVGLELVSLFYLVRHLREDQQQDDQQAGSR